MRDVIARATKRERTITNYPLVDLAASMVLLTVVNSRSFRLKNASLSDRLFRKDLLTLFRIVLFVSD